MTELNTNNIGRKHKGEKRAEITQKQKQSYKNKPSK